VVERELDQDLDFRIQGRTIARGASRTMNSRHLTGHAIDLISSRALRALT
jgi:hypothetical protein